MKYLQLFSFCLGLFVLVSCDDDNDTKPSTSGTVVLDITNIAGTVNVDETGATNYTNANGDNFSVTKLKYYISNVKLLKGDAVAYSMPESYFLVDESKLSSTKLSLPQVPNGSYTGIRFTLGVDSARNVSGAQTGALTPSDMFWTWSTGYIFFKMEGVSYNSPDSSYIYHIAGFRNSNNTNALRDVRLDFGDDLIVDGPREAEIHVFADILKVFSAVHPISISAVHYVMSPGNNALLIADNYAQMFTFDHLHN